MYFLVIILQWVLLIILSSFVLKVENVKFEIILFEVKEVVCVRVF